ncbi:MAG: S41 family peptidase [Muribaculum sp.]|nr:S41 family peptidase [Muribaculum sp.]
MTKRNKTGLILCPTLLALGIIAGIFIGKALYSPHLSVNQMKMLEILDLIESDYVDTLNTDSLLEQNYSQLISLLDPHSAYIPASDLTAINEDLEGSFSGVGVSFQIIGDTVSVIDVVAGGPAEHTGIFAGDKIIKASDFDLTGTAATNENVYKHLRGKKGTKVTLTIMRSNSAKPLKFEITRGDVPVNSVDSKYMADERTGYVKVSKFSQTTYNEFYEALNELSAKGASQFIVDLRGNSGGYMDQAILMANEFLPKGSMIVYTKGKNAINESVAVADGRGSFKDEPLTILIDEFSASASEILSGALQDNDRALIIGRRSFGKGLVQNQTNLLDGSALRLTVARYFTPSGRSIQKQYQRGESGKYELDITERLSRGEFYYADSIKLDLSHPFATLSGRKVYGGGGIMPDIFVPQDTTGITSYYIAVTNANLIQKYAYQVVERYREVLKNAHTIEQVIRIIPRDNTLLTGFVEYAARNGVPARWYYIRQSQQLILNQLKAVIVRDALGYGKFIEALNYNDNTVIKALEQLNKGVKPSDVNFKFKTSK